MFNHARAIQGEKPKVAEFYDRSQKSNVWHKKQSVRELLVVISVCYKCAAQIRPNKKLKSSAKKQRRTPNRQMSMQISKLIL